MGAGQAGGGGQAGGRAGDGPADRKLQAYRRPRTGGWAANGGIRREGGGRATGAQPAASGRAAGKRAGGQAGRKAGGGWKAAGPGWVGEQRKTSAPFSNSKKLVFALGRCFYRDSFFLNF